MTRKPVRLGQFSIMRFCERLLYAVVQGIIIGHIIRLR
jgi:hypothetical protein